jgi:hypothetical protein
MHGFADGRLLQHRRFSSVQIFRLAAASPGCSYYVLIRMRVINLSQLLFKTLLMGWRHDKAAKIKAALAGC